MTTCACNKPYYPESTGEGPCHDSCERCDEIIPENNNAIATEYNMCIDCMTDYLEDQSNMQKFIQFGKKLINRDKAWNYVKTDLKNWFEVLEAFNN